MLYRFEIELSDIDRGVYESLKIRVAQHPSESAPYLLTRVLAFALNYQDGIEFSPEGLGDPDGPALWVPGPHGGTQLWIDIGNPAARRMHKASKAADQVLVFTYKNAATWLAQIDPSEVHRSESIRIYAIDASFLAELEAKIEKINRWTLIHQQGRIDLNTGSADYVTELRCLTLT